MSEFTIEPQPLVDENPNTDKVFKNVKEFRLADGKVRIKDGAIIITDETGTDRVLIGYGEGLF